MGGQELFWIVETLTADCHEMVASVFPNAECLGEPVLVAPIKHAALPADLTGSGNRALCFEAMHCWVDAAEFKQSTETKDKMVFGRFMTFAIVAACVFVLMSICCGIKAVVFKTDEFEEEEEDGNIEIQAQQWTETDGEDNANQNSWPRFI